MPEDIPEFYAITAPLRVDGSAGSIFEQAACRDWLGHFERLLAGDIRLVQLRAKDLPPEQLRELARHCGRRAESRGIRLVLNGPAALAVELSLAGVHLTARALMASRRRPLPGEYLVGTSCHSAAELARAEAIGADFACLSPVRMVKAYADRQVLGFDGFGALARACGIPVFALGGLRRGDLEVVQRAGGHGVAGISGFWN